MIVLEEVIGRYADKVVVDRVSMELQSGELTVFLGPSGCGKTTTLKLINRLLPLAGGRILVGGRDIASCDPIALRRGIGYVIQEAGLFPHYRVFDNVAIVPRLLGWDAARVKARVEEMLRLVNLAPDLQGRFPGELSGGQRQRVGVARALAGDPEILLMDEPFGAIDPINRKRIREEFRKIQRHLGKTVVMVTHDLDEALELGDRIAVFNAGRLEQFDTPEALLARPATPFVADFLGGDRATRLLERMAVGSARGPAATGGLAGMAAESSARGLAIADDLACVPSDASVIEAIARMVVTGRSEIRLVGEAGRPEGTVSLDGLLPVPGREPAHE